MLPPFPKSNTASLPILQKGAGIRLKEDVQAILRAMPYRPVVDLLPLRCTIY